MEILQKDTDETNYTSNRGRPTFKVNRKKDRPRSCHIDQTSPLPLCLSPPSTKTFLKPPSHHLLSPVSELTNHLNDQCIVSPSIHVVRGFLFHSPTKSTSNKSSSGQPMMVYSDVSPQVVSPTEVGLGSPEDKGTAPLSPDLSPSSASIIAKESFSFKPSSSSAATVATSSSSSALLRGPLFNMRRTRSFSLPKPFVQDCSLDTGDDSNKENNIPFDPDVPHAKRLKEHQQLQKSPISISASGINFPPLCRGLGSPTGNECLQDADVGGKCVLPTIVGSHADLNCITPQTMREVLAGQYSELFQEIFIVDCRFPYEYTGGHIRSALHIPCTKDIKERFVDSLLRTGIAPGDEVKPTAIIFYCEFSSKRGPTCCRFLRKVDREANISHYPQLFYPETYVLEGGYKSFFENCKDLCEPQSYIEMKDKRFCDELKESSKELRQMSWRRSKSLTFPHSSAAAAAAAAANNSSTASRSLSSLSTCSFVLR